MVENYTTLIRGILFIMYMFKFRINLMMTMKFWFWVCFGYDCS